MKKNGEKHDKAPETATAATTAAPDEKLNDTQASSEAQTQEQLPETVTLTRDEFKEVKAHIDKLTKEKDETVALAQRLQADFDNYRRRNASIHVDSMDEGVRTVVKELLPVLDNLDRALLNAGGVDKSFVDGIALLQRQLIDQLAKHGLCEIDASGNFDPEMHEAVLQEEKEGAKSGEIIDVLQKGYKVKDRIIRHSMVKVAK